MASAADEAGECPQAGEKRTSRAGQGVLGGREEQDVVVRQTMKGDG